MARELVYKIRIDYDTASAKEGSQTLERSQESAEQAVNKTTSAINRQAEAQESASNASRNYQRNQSRANQVLFSYGDLLNDAQQFQFGFSNGLRAIGNNIGFAAEGIANLNTKAGGFRGTLKALGSSLIGPGGLILGLNLAVTAVTVFGDSLFGAGEKASEAEKDIKSFREEINRFSIQFDQLTQLQEEAFPDQTQLQGLRQQVQFAREIEATLLNRLDTSESQVKRLERQVELFSDLESGQTTVNKAIKEGLISRELGEAILQGEVDVSQNLLRFENKLADAKTEKASLEESVQSAQEREIQLLAKINEQEAARESSTFQSLQNIIKARQARTQGGGGPFGFEAANLTPDQVSQAFAIDPLGDERTIANQRVEIQRDTAEKIKQIKQDEVSTRVALERQAFGAISSIAQALAPQNKALALSLIAIEKGLKIAQVIIDGTQKAAAATSQGFLFLSNPATAPLASQAFASASAIKANTATAVGLIAAQGLAEGARALQLGGGGGDRIGGGATGGGSTPEGFRTGRIESGERDFINTVGRSNREPRFIIQQNNVLPDTEISVRAENGRKQRVSNTRRVASV